MTDLKPFQQRTFVPLSCDLLDKNIVVGLYDSLLQRAVCNVVEFERFLLDRSELESALGQAGSFLYIAMTCDTQDEAKALAYQKFVEEVSPAVKPLDHALNCKFLQLNRMFPLDAHRYLVYCRGAEASVKLFIEKNIPIQTEVALLSQQYQAICGAMSVLFNGKEHTLPEMAPYMLEPDCALREGAWRAVASRRMQDKDKLEELFDRMRVLRNDMASNAGFSNFRDFQFASYLRFDYTPGECKEYHVSMKDLVVPLCRDIDQLRKKHLKIDVLRPWDLAVDPFNRPPLKPFTDIARLKDGVGKIIRKIDSELFSLYEDMRSLNLLDLDSRKGKAPGGYQNTLSEARKPFIFMNAVGVDDDIRTLLHESGHAFHAYLCASDPLVDYRHAPMEFCEVASMSMELMANDYMNEFYSPDDARRSVTEFFEGVLSTLVWVATVDCFQHWIYENPAHTPQDRAAAWLRINKEFSTGVTDWTGLEMERTYLWHRQLHIFEVPFYYIEYGIAQLGALQIWLRFRNDPAAAVEFYNKGLSLGGARPLPELFKAAGIEFDFSSRMIAPLVAEVRAKWKELSGE